MRNIIGFFISFLLLLPSVAFPEIKEIISEGTYNMGDGETPTVAESRALLQAKRVAVEQAGTYIESYSKVKNFQLTHDEIQVLASGVMEVTILDKKRTIVGDGVNFWIKISARVSSDKVDAMANRVKERMIVEDYKRLQRDYEKSQTEITDLKKRIKGAKSEEERKQIGARITDEERLFQAKEWAEKGNNYRLNKKYDNAIDAYTRAITLEPNDAYYYICRSSAYYLKGQLDKALEDLNRGIALSTPFLDSILDPPFYKVFYPSVYLMRGALYAVQGQYERAIEDFNQAIAFDPRGEAYCSRGFAYQEGGQLDKAAEDYSKCIASNPNDSKTYDLRGGIYLRKGQYDKAIEDFNKAIAINPNYYSAYASRGQTYAIQGTYDKAIEDYNKAIAINPNYAFAYLQRGITYATKGDKDKALEDFNKAISIDPKYVDAYKARGISYIAKGQLDRALEDYSKAIFLNPNDAHSYVMRGVIYSQKGQNDRAFYDLNKAITIDPKSGEAYLFRGALYSDIGQNDKAISDLKTACELGKEIGCEQLRKTYGITARNPDASRKEAFLFLKNGLDYSKKKQFDRAIQEFTKAINSEPRYTTAYYDRGCAYFGKGDHEKAIEDFSIAIAIDSSYTNAYYNRGITYEKKSQMEKAKADFQKACDLGDQDGCKKVTIHSGSR